MDAFLILGALYLLIGHKDRTMLTKHDWNTHMKVWPALLLSRHSEKPSVAKLLDQVFKSLQKYSETFAIHNVITEKVVRMAFDLIPTSAAAGQVCPASHFKNMCVAISILSLFQGGSCIETNRG